MDSYQLALAEQLQGRDAAVSLQAALDERTKAHGPKSPEALEVLLTLISEHTRHSRPDQAKAGLDELIRRGPEGAHAMVGSFYASFRDWEKALPHYEQALAGPGDRGALLHALGRTRLELGRLDEGRAALEESVKLGCTAAAVDLSDALVLNGSLDEAIKVLEQARASADRRWAVECTSRLGALLRASGKPQDAEKHAKDAVMSAEELDPSAAVLPLLELAATQAQLGRNADALIALERANKAIEGGDDYAWAQVQLRLGAHLLYGFPNREAEAVPCLNRALGLLTALATAESPECAEVLMHLSVASLRKGDLAAAEGLAARSAALYERAYGKGNRLSSGPLHLLGAIRLAKGDQSGAKEALARAAAAGPSLISGA